MAITFHLIPCKLDVFDEEEFGKSNVDFYATVTNINTGKAEYEPRWIDSKVLTSILYSIKV